MEYKKADVERAFLQDKFFPHQLFCVWGKGNNTICIANFLYQEGGKGSAYKFFIILGIHFEK